MKASGSAASDALSHLVTWVEALMCWRHLWIDSHPDIGTPDSDYPGVHAMTVAALTGHGDPDILWLLPTTVTPGRCLGRGARVERGRLPERRRVGHPVLRPG